MKDYHNIQPQQKYKILLIGDIGEDIYTYGNVNRISPEAPVPVFEPKYVITKAGMAGNVANNLEALGCLVDFLHGETSVKNRLIDIRSKQQLIRMDKDVESKPMIIQKEISTYDAVVISDYNKGTVDYDLVTHLIKTVTVPIFIDTKKPDLAALNGCYIKINSLEHSRAISQAHPQWLITTRGDQGAVWNGQTFPSESAGNVTDVCGAGDTFLSALVYKFLDTNSISDAIKFANKAAAITVQHVGVYAPRLEEIS